MRILGCDTPALAELTAVNLSPLKWIFAHRKLTYSFPHGDGTAYTNFWSVRRDEDLTADPEPILYDERNPQSAVVLRHIPGHIEVDNDCRLTEGLFHHDK